MRIRYSIVIQESEDELVTLERQMRGQRTAVRVQLLRLLKSGQVGSLEAASHLLGYSERQLKRWWQAYRTGGIPALLTYHVPPGRPTRLSEEAWDALQEELRAGRIVTLEEARRYLAEEWHIRYRSVHAIWYLLRRRGTRRKTARHRHEHRNMSL